MNEKRSGQEILKQREANQKKTLSSVLNYCKDLEFNIQKVLLVIKRLE